MKLTPIVRALAFATAAASIGADAQSTLYRWVDKDGKVYFTDTPPPGDAKNATQKATVPSAFPCVFAVARTSIWCHSPKCCDQRNCVVMPRLMPGVGLSRFTAM